MSAQLFMQELWIIAFMTNFSAKCHSDTGRSQALLYLSRKEWDPLLGRVAVMLPKMEKNWSNAWICLYFPCLQESSTLGGVHLSMNVSASGHQDLFTNTFLFWMLLDLMGNHSLAKSDAIYSQHSVCEMSPVLYSCNTVCSQAPTTAPSADSLMVFQFNYSTV